MPHDFENQAKSPVEIEPLLSAFYNENSPDTDRADRLWRRLEPQLNASTVQRGRVGGWFSNFQQKWKFSMKKDTPLLERDDTGYEVEKVRRGHRVGSLVGALAALVLVLGLVAVFALNAGKGPSITPGVGGQPVATNTVQADLPQTPTPVPYDSRTPFPATADPHATATPVPYTTPDGSPRPTPTVGPEPTFDPNATATPLPFSGTVTVPASGNIAPTPTPAPSSNTSDNPVDTTPSRLDRADNVTVIGLANVPVDYNYDTLPAEIKAAKPEVHFYASKNSPAYTEKSLYDALVKAGYTVPDPVGSAAKNGGTIPPGGVFIYAKKVGQPDLYINLVSIASGEEVAKLSKTAYFSGGKNFENTVNAIRVKGYPYLLMVISGDKLLETIYGGSDPGAGTPPGTPTPVK